jgi:hypothetical protein
LSVNKQSEDSHAHRNTVFSPPIEATAPTPTRDNENQAFEALKCLEDEEIQKYLAARHGKRALQAWPKSSLPKMLRTSTILEMAGFEALAEVAKLALLSLAW